MKGSTAIARVLKAEGVDTVFCFPNNPLIDAAAGEGIRPIITRTERTAINMADGYGRASNGRKLGVVIMQDGPGIENAFGGIAQAYADSTPLLALPGAPDRRRLGLPVSFDAVRNYSGVTKWADTVLSGDDIAAKMRRAFTYLRTGRTRPVLLQTPRDVMLEEVDEVKFSYRPVKGRRSGGDPADIREAARVLLAVRRPVLHAGQGVLYAEAWDELRELAELVEAPVMTTTLGKSVFPESHPLALGAGGTSVSPLVAHFLPRADLIFSVGSSLSRTLASCPLPAGKTLVQCTLDDHDLNAEYDLDHAVIGDAKLVLQALVDEVKRTLGETARRGTGEAVQEIAAVKAEALAHWMPKLSSDETPLNPYRVFWELNRNLPKDRTIITHDSGNVRDQIVPFYESSFPRSYLGWGNSTPLGFSLGVAMGAKLAQPDKVVVHCLGDTALGMCGMDLETKVRERIAVLTVLINNGAMGGYEHYMPIATEKYRSKFLGGDYVGLAKSLGGHVERVEQPGEIEGAIGRAVAVVDSGVPAFLEFVTREEGEFSRL